MVMLWIWLAIGLLSAYQAALSDYFLKNEDIYQLDAYTWESRAFREMRLGEVFLAGCEGGLDLDCLTTLMIGQSYDLTHLTKEELDRWSLQKAVILARKPIEYRKLKNAYKMVFADIGCFPVPASIGEGAAPVTYEDSFLEARTYGGEHLHEGCDILGDGAPRGTYPVLSMTGGTVEEVGWSEKDGWRIGVRAPSGAYFYYAHLYGYGEEWEVGDLVVPGSHLGYMGDSGYGVQEGTVGNLEIRLHVGIFISTDHYESLSINPYWVLRYSERSLREVDR